MFKTSQAKQRKVSLEQAVEKAKVGRQDTVRIFSYASAPCMEKYMYLFLMKSDEIKHITHVYYASHKCSVSVCAEGEKLYAEAVEGSERGANSAAGRVGKIQGM